MSKDYYETLGITKDATDDEIKRAYRMLAKKYHPDVSEEPTESAEEKFKEISEAYEILMDTEKRKIYDNHGHAGVNNQFSGGGFSWNDFTRGNDINDIFGDIFGSMFRGGGFGRRQASSRNSPRAGESLRYDIEVELVDVFKGKTVEISVPFNSSCSTCKGTGGKDGKVKICSKCGGKGQAESIQRTPLGNMLVEVDCPDCRGSGRSFKERCSKCKGSGRHNATAKISINIPKGVEANSRIKVPGGGDSGYNGGPPGDLYIVIHVKEDKNFQRDGDNLWTEVITTYSRLVLGGEEEIETIDGKIMRVKIPSGTQVGGVLKISGEGLPKIKQSARGNLFARVMIQVPTKVSSYETELLSKLDVEAGRRIINKKPKYKQKLDLKG